VTAAASEEPEGTGGGEGGGGSPLAKHAASTSSRICLLLVSACYGRLAVVSDVDDGGFALNVDKELRGSAVL
jgi:hypothetical protein